ncbi:MAG: AMP-binding acetyl-CoA synthetase, partial [Pseudomonas sp.]|nr:AMP-binding acetyl-CoA synthetase [Pseudomonas sp.]
RLPILGKLVGRKVRAGLGLDACRVALSGAAPVPETLLNWYRRLGLDVLEVYGMTESCGYSHISLPDKQKLGWIGQSCPHVDVRIDASGEVQVRSGATMRGYFKEPQKTAETLTEDGFLRTGDKGEQDAEGYLRLTGRLKEIFKTSKGKYVAPAPIENRLAVHNQIEQVCVVGDGLSAPLGLCVLSASGLQDAAGGARSTLHKSLETLLEEVNAALDKHERLRRLIVVKDSWAVENGFLTPTLKIKRAFIESTYGARFEEWSARSGAVLWQE